MANKVERSLEAQPLLQGAGELEDLPAKPPSLGYEPEILGATCFQRCAICFQKCVNSPMGKIVEGFFKSKIVRMIALPLIAVKLLLLFSNPGALVITAVVVGAVAFGFFFPNPRSALQQFKYELSGFKKMNYSLMGFGIEDAVFQDNVTKRFFYANVGDAPPNTTTICPKGFSLYAKNRNENGKLEGNVYVGRCPQRRLFGKDDARKLKEEGIAVVFDLTHHTKSDVNGRGGKEGGAKGAFQPQSEKEVVAIRMEYEHLPVVDHELLTHDELNRAVEILKKHLQAGRNVYIHCHGGKGRSAMAFAAYLMKEKGKTAEQAANIIELFRPQSTIKNKIKDKPYPDGVRGLASYETRLRDKCAWRPKVSNNESHPFGLFSKATDSEPQQESGLHRVQEEGGFFALKDGSDPYIEGPEVSDEVEGGIWALPCIPHEPAGVRDALSS